MVTERGLTLDNLNFLESDIQELGLRDLEDDTAIVQLLYSCIQNPECNNRDWLIEHYNKYRDCERY